MQIDPKQAELKPTASRPPQMGVSLAFYQLIIKLKIFPPFSPSSLPFALLCSRWVKCQEEEEEEERIVRESFLWEG